MCLITFAYKAHPKYDLILLANRDEFYARPARKAKFWTEEGLPNLLAGKDLEAGGTWMGIEKGGRWGALTNYRDLSLLKETPPSRGQIVLDYLKNKRNAREYSAGLRYQGWKYNDFNLLLGDWDELLFYSTITNSINLVLPGIHSLSNALLDTPWKKVESTKLALKKTLEKDNLDNENLFKILSNTRKADDSELPDTGLDIEMERVVSSAFIKSKDYGTRCSTILMIDKNGKVNFTERTFEPETGKTVGEESFEF